MNEGTFPIQEVFVVTGRGVVAMVEDQPALLRQDMLLVDDEQRWWIVTGIELRGARRAGAQVGLVLRATENVKSLPMGSLKLALDPVEWVAVQHVATWLGMPVELVCGTDAPPVGALRRLLTDAIRADRLTRADTAGVHEALRQVADEIEKRRGREAGLRIQAGDRHDSRGADSSGDREDAFAEALGVVRRVMGGEPLAGPDEQDDDR